MFGSIYWGIRLEDKGFLSNVGANFIFGFMIFGVIFTLIVSILNWKNSILYKLEFAIALTLGIILIDLFFFCNFGLCPE
jgi:hypothetical protein